MKVNISEVHKSISKNITSQKFKNLFRVLVITEEHQNIPDV